MCVWAYVGAGYLYASLGNDTGNLKLEKFNVLFYFQLNDTTLCKAACNQFVINTRDVWRAICTLEIVLNLTYEEDGGQWGRGGQFRLRGSSTTPKPVLHTRMENAWMDGLFDLGWFDNEFVSLPTVIRLI